MRSPFLKFLIRYWYLWLAMAGERGSRGGGGSEYLKNVVFATLILTPKQAS